jgi:elongation factor Ts
MADISAALVKELRERTGAGFMDCKKALTDADGDLDKAIALLRERGLAAAAKKSGRDAREGLVSSYIHTGGRVGVLIEVNCETDFVARNEEFVNFAREMAVHVASAAPRYVSAEDVPEDERAREMAVFEQQADDSKPPDVRRKIAEGRFRKWLEEVVLLEQKHVNTDRYDGRTIEQLRAEISAKTGENVVIRRFARFRVGE